MSTGSQRLIQPVILCGGSGTRLWPVSTPERPKPFIKLLGERTLFQQALGRVADPARFAAPIVVAGEAHRQWVAEQSDRHALIIEPCARNTAPAIALAAARLPAETLMLVCPSDHYIADEAAFLHAVDAASQLAAAGNLVSLGIEPDRPETGYGYIERGEALGAGHRTARFVEKPDAATAADYLAAGNFAWNAGIFVFPAGQLLAELAQYRPEMVDLVRLAVAQGSEDGETFRPAAGPFSGIAAESVDYALMENTSHAAVVTADMGWTDIGSWKALMDARGRDASEGVEHAELLDCERVMVRSDGRRVSAVGLKDVIIVVEKDDVLVVARDAAQEVGSLKAHKST